MKTNQNPRAYTKTIPHYLIIILIVVVGILVYHRALKGIFIFDDKALILDNPLIKNVRYLKDIFITHSFYGSGIYSNFYRPIESLSFMLDYHLWGLNPFGYHLTNILIHIFNALSVYFLVYLISKKQNIAIITGLLFCVHTVLSWPVYYIASRSDNLSALLFFISIILYILYKQIGLGRNSIFLYLSSVIFFIASLLSKESTILLPFILLLYLYCFSDRQKKAKKKSPNLIWIFFLIIAVYIYLRSTILDFTEGKLLETTTGIIPLYNRLLTTSKVIMIYLRLLLLPIGLHMEWDIAPASSFLQDEVLLSVVGLVIIGIFASFLLRTSKLKFFAISWFFITLFPYFNIFPLPYFVGEPWLYIPSVGFFMLLAIYLYELGRRSKLWSYVVGCIVVSAIIFYGILTIRRADVWADPVNLYTEILKYSPNNTRARINLGVILAESGSDEEAMQRYEEAAKLAPTDSGALANIGSIYAKKEQYDMALEGFKKAIELNPEDFVAHMNIGIIYKKKGDFKKAMEEYKKAIDINPHYPLVYNNIGNIYLEKGQYEEAIRFYEKAIGLNPYEAVFYANLGKAYKNKGMQQKARESFEKSLQLNPNHKDAIDGLRSLK